MSRNRKNIRLEHWHYIAALLAVYDAVVANGAYFLALWIRFDGLFTAIPAHYKIAWMEFAPIYTVVVVGVFIALRLYNSIWRFASFHELLRVLIASVITSVIHTVLITVFVLRMPISYYVIGMGLQFILVLGIRFSYRFVLLQRSKRSGARVERTMLIGAGNAGQSILRDVSGLREQNLKIVCIMDDNPNKWGRYVDGIPVAGGREDIPTAVKKYRIKKILLAIPSARPTDMRDILNICKETGCQLRILPGISQLVSGKASLGEMKEVSVEELLGREPVRVNMDQITEEIRDKVVLVTGGGGSIGSELCRQVAARAPRSLVIFDVYENNAYDIQNELKEAYPELNLQVIIGSVRDSRRIEQVFATYKPHIVYHAAAHKHVPLMEDSPCESIKNNVMGTYKTAYAALRHGCRRFVLISTDKAVNPTNIMGASKRLCEMVIQSFDRAVKTGDAKSLPAMFTHSEPDAPLPLEGPFVTEFVAVRFGNVLGSNGSVIPLFKKQIAKGGPVTVTHPDIIRYFMTIPEAVSLVMQAGVYAKGGEIFVLDMGAPVKIDELARNLIKLSGHKPDEDIMVVYTGLRPGEKLYEEKLMAEEGLQKTENRLIHIGSPLPFDTEVFLTQLKALMASAYRNDPNICAMVSEIVPTYRPDRAGEKDTTYAELSAASR